MSPPVGAGSACCWRSVTQLPANPTLKMPPGKAVVYRSLVTESGAMASRSGGRVPATKSCEMPENEIPTSPTLWRKTQGWLPTICTAS